MFKNCKPFVILVTVIYLALFISGCATGPQPERIALDTSAQSIKTVALLEIDELPDHLALNLSGTPTLFGAIGGAVSGAKTKKRTKKLTALMKSENLTLGAQLTDLIEERLKQDGYKVIRLSNAREKPGYIVTDYKNIQTDADAIFDVIINIAGYIDRGVGKPYKPIVNARGQLVSTKDYEIKYLNVVNYGYKLVNNEWVHLPQIDTTSFDNFNALLASSEQAANALKNGIEPIANELTKEF